MKWVVLVVRVLVGLGFTLGGGAYFFVPMPDLPADMPEAGKQFMGVLVPTHYMSAVKACELVGGLLLLSGRLTPLGVVVLMPVAVNIVIWDFAIMRQPGLGLPIVGLLAVVMAGYWNYFSPFFTPTAKMV